MFHKNKNVNSGPRLRPAKASSPANSVGRFAPRSQETSIRQTFSMQNRPMPGDVRRQAIAGDATLGVKSRYTPIADANAARQAFNSGRSTSVVTRPRGLGGPRAL